MILVSEENRHVYELFQSRIRARLESRKKKITSVASSYLTGVIFLLLASKLGMAQTASPKPIATPSATPISGTSSPVSAMQSLGGSILQGVSQAVSGVAASVGVPVPAASPSSGPADPFAEIRALRDPFKAPPLPVLVETPKSDLERYPLDQYKLKAIMTGPKKMRAMIVGPNGKTFIVAESSRLGSRRGVIYKITRVSLKIKEKVPNSLGEDEIVESELRLFPSGQKVGLSAEKSDQSVAQ
jgi:hypothetical protein